MFSTVSPPLKKTGRHNGYTLVALLKKRLVLHINELNLYLCINPYWCMFALTHYFFQVYILPLSFSLSAVCLFVSLNPGRSDSLCLLSVSLLSVSLSVCIYIYLNLSLSLCIYVSKFLLRSFPLLVSFWKTKGRNVNPYGFSRAKQTTKEQNINPSDPSILPHTLSLSHTQRHTHKMKKQKNCWPVNFVLQSFCFSTDSRPIITERGEIERTRKKREREGEREREIKREIQRERERDGRYIVGSQGASQLGGTF